jgi:hypothetical protein
VALVESLVAAALVVLAVWMWRHGQDRVTYDVAGTPYTVTSLAGNWAGGAIALCLPAGLALLDAGRRLAPLPNKPGKR